MDIGQLGRGIVVVGLVVLVAGAVLVAVSALGVGRLPGDLAFRGRNVRVFVPLASSLVVSVVLTILLNLLVRR